MPRAALLLAAALLAAALAGCSGREVRVRDPWGKPVAGASVRAVAPSRQSEPATTGADGVARIGDVTGEQWLSVGATGYRTHFSTMPPRFPATVTLEPGTDVESPATRERPDSTWTPVHEKE